MSSSSNTSSDTKTIVRTLEALVADNHTTDKELIDDCFYIEKTRWGTFRSVTKEGKEVITALHEDLCVQHTRFYLRGLQEGFDSLSSSTYGGTVDGKL